MLGFCQTFNKVNSLGKLAFGKERWFSSFVNGTVLGWSSLVDPKVEEGSKYSHPEVSLENPINLTSV